MISKPEEAIIKLQAELFDAMSADVPVNSWKPKAIIDWPLVAQIISDVVEDVRKIQKNSNV